MSIREDYSYFKARKAEKEAIREAEEKQIKEAFNKAVIDREDLKSLREARIDNFYKYKDDVKRTLVKKALMELCVGSIQNPIPSEIAMCENLIENYIDEAGAAKLLRTMKHSNNSILRTIAEKADEAYDDITDGANADDEYTQTISKEAINKFWNDVDKSEDVEDITNLIHMRVSNAEEEFVNKNQEDKEDVKTILKQTATRVQNAKASNDNDYSDAVEESETRLAKDKIYQIQHEGKRNVFDKMVRNLSEVAMSNSEAKKIFTDSNGRLNLNKIVESARCMYTLLETVSTIQLEKVDEQYIEDTLKSIKK